MKYLTCFLIILLSACGGGSGSDGSVEVSQQSIDTEPSLSERVSQLARLTQPSPETDLQDFVFNYNSFVFSQFQDRKIVSTDSNFVITPYSIYSLYGQLAYPANGDTLHEIRESLHITQTNEIFFSALNHIDRAHMTTNSLNISNKMFAHASYDFAFAFLQNSVGFFGTQVEFPNFTGDIEQTKNTILGSIQVNTPLDLAKLDWLENVEVKDRLVLTNQLSMRADLETAFSEDEVVSGEFTTLNFETISLDFLSARLAVNYYSDGSEIIVELPLKDTNLSLLLLTSEAIDFRDLVSDISNQKMNERYALMQPVDLLLEVPRFSVELTDSKIIPTGLTDTFDERKANFDLINDRRIQDLYVREGAHSSTFEFTNHGIDTASLTAIVAQKKPEPINQNNTSTGVIVTGFDLMPIPVTERVPLVQFNQPFVFLLRDTQNNAILQVGIVNNPLLN